MSRLGFLALLLASAVSAAETPVVSSLAGRWQYVQPPDPEGEILDLTFSLGRWRGVMNGLERAGEHGLYYYAVALESVDVARDGSIHFEVGERTLFSRRPALSATETRGEAGIVRDRMRFAGRVEAGELVLRCADPGGSCPDTVMRFTRLPADRERGRQDSTFHVAARFDVTDQTPRFERALGPALRLRVRREPPLGWVISVVTRTSQGDSPNLLYHSRSVHGPYPTDVFAWSHQSRLFPDERILPVYGHPYEIRVRLIDGRVSGSGESAVFEAGTIEVAWREAEIQREQRE